MGAIGHVTTAALRGAQEAPRGENNAVPAITQLSPHTDSRERERAIPPTPSRLRKVRSIEVSLPKWGRKKDGWTANDLIERLSIDLENLSELLGSFVGEAGSSPTLVAAFSCFSQYAHYLAAQADEAYLLLPKESESTKETVDLSRHTKRACCNNGWPSSVVAGAIERGLSTHIDYMIDTHAHTVDKDRYRELVRNCEGL
jgi:hypothetical protein